MYSNAAAPAVREPHSTDHFEWEPTGGISFPGAYSKTDFDNRGDKGIQAAQERNRQNNRPSGSAEQTDRFLYLNGGLWGQLGNFGLTATADILRYDVSSSIAGQSPLAVGITRINLCAAYAFLNNQLIVGGGLRMAYVALSEKSSSSSAAIDMFGAAPQAGLIVKPEGKQFRVGVTARLPVSAGTFNNITNLVIQSNSDGTTVRKAGDFIAPRKIVQPYEVEAGVAYQLGPRPLNPTWVDPVDHERELQAKVKREREYRLVSAQQEIANMPGSSALDRAARAARIATLAHEETILRSNEDLELVNADRRLYEERRARYLNWPRERVLLLASVLMTGASTEAVALEGFLEQRREIVGTRISVAPRFALESEAVPNFLKVRSGVYLEPSRFADGTHRQHFTFGADFRLFAWSVFGIFPDHQWRVSAFIDAAERYQNFGVGIGTWH